MRGLVTTMFAVIFFTCNQSTITDQNSTNFKITGETINGVWNGKYAKQQTCTDSNGLTILDTTIFACTYEIYRDSLKICRDIVIHSKCNNAISICDLPDRTLIKSFWKLKTDSLKDSLYAYRISQNVQMNKIDTSLTNRFELTSIGQNRLVFHSNDRSDTCTKQ